MGEMADYLHDMWNDGWGDEQEQDERSHGITCKYCRKSGFVWSKTEAGWRLATPRGVLHTCDKHPRYNREKNDDDGNHHVHQPSLFG